jgi:hypothetical protein
LSLSLDDLLADFKCEEDIVGLWQVVRGIRERFPETPDNEIFQATLSFVQTMLAHGFEAGDPPYSASGFACWNDQRPEAVLARIDQEWRNLGKDPDLPDIAWFLPPGMNN